MISLATNCLDIDLILSFYRNEVDQRLIVTCLSILDLQDTAKVMSGFDFIVSNPPYVPSGTIPQLQPEIKK